MSCLHSYCPASIIPDPEAVIPADFYDVRVEVAPKAGLLPMYSFTALIYAAALTAFIVLYQLEASKSTVETIIIPYDNTGNSGYTCQMISRVSATHNIPSYDDPELAYNLVNVMELKSDCETSLAVANPCSEPMTFFPGTVSELWPVGATFGAAAMYKETNIFVMATTAHASITNYNYSGGTYQADVIDLPADTVTTSLAVDRNGEPIYLAMSSAYNAIAVFRANMQTQDPVLNFDTGSLTATVLNDNLYNIYYATNTTFSYLDVYTAATAQATLLFTVEDGDRILHSAVYHDGTSPTVYYYTANSALTSSFYSFKDNVITLYDHVLDEQASVQGMVADATYVYFSQHLSQDHFNVVRQVPGEVFRDANVISYFESSLPTPAFAIDPSGGGQRIFLVQGDEQNAQNWAFLYPQSQEYYVNGVYTVPSPYHVFSMIEFGAEWFVCGDQMLNGTQYDAGEVVEYPQVCSDNGLVGKVIYAEQSYTFSATDAASFTISSGASHCAALAAPICNTVASLPPYSCSRTLHPGFFLSAATALANSQLLVQVLIFCFAVMLPRLAKTFPVVPHMVSEGSTSAAAAVSAASDSVMAHAHLPHHRASTAAGHNGTAGARNTTADAYVEMAPMSSGSNDHNVSNVVYDVESPMVPRNT